MRFHSVFAIEGYYQFIRRGAVYFDRFQSFGVCSSHGNVPRFGGAKCKGDVFLSRGHP